MTTTWRLISGTYAVGAAVSETAHRDSHGPIVHLYLDDGDIEIERGVAAISRVLRRALAVSPGNVVITTHREARRARVVDARPRHNGHATTAP